MLRRDPSGRHNRGHRCACTPSPCWSADGRHARHGIQGDPAPVHRLADRGPLQKLSVLANEAAAAGEFEAILVASPFNASLLPGSSTTLWGYNDAYPGPLIELQEGDRVAIEFVNRLALDSTIHWHGLAIPAALDGNPMDPVPPGAARRYVFEIPSGSAARTGTTRALTARPRCRLVMGWPHRSWCATTTIR